LIIYIVKTYQFTIIKRTSCRHVSKKLIKKRTTCHDSFCQSTDYHLSNVVRSMFFLSHLFSLYSYGRAMYIRFLRLSTSREREKLVLIQFYCADAFLHAVAFFAWRPYLCRQTLGMLSVEQPHSYLGCTIFVSVLF
jgi:hypothetical protein